MKNMFMIVSMILVSVLFLSACSKNGDFDPSRNITVVAREDGSGTKSAFMDIIGLKEKADPPNVIIHAGTAAVFAEVRTNETAIAYESLGYVSDEAKILSIDGVEATVANIQDGTYAIARPLSVIYKENVLLDEVNNAFLIFLQSSNAQEIINAEGYVSLTNNALPYTINGTLSGSIDVSGSTSVQPLMIELARAFEDLQPNVIVNVSGGGSGTGYRNTEQGVSDFGMISEEFNITNAPSCTHLIVAKDGIAVIVNNNNPLDNITMEQLRNIYDVDAGANAISTWEVLMP